MAIRHFLLMLVICIVWGFAIVAGKFGVVDFPPLFFTAIRYMILTALLAPFVRIVPGSMRQIVAIAMLMGWLHFGLFYAGVALANNLSAISIVTQVGVPFSTILSIVLLHEKVGWKRWLGIGLAFGGVALISFEPTIINERGALVFVISSQLAGAFGVILMKQMPPIGIYQMQGWIAILSAPPLLLLSLLLESNHLTVLQTASLTSWGGLLFTAIGASLIGHAGFYYLVQRYDVTITSPLTLMAPVFGVVFGVWVWGDQISATFLLGGVVTLCGVLIIAVRGKQEAKVPA